MELYDLGSLPPDEQIELAQGLIDTGLSEHLRQYPPLCDYFIAEGLCYDVHVGEDTGINTQGS